MRKSSAKIIRKLAGHIDNNPTTRRVYRRLKKHYTLLNKKDKTSFMDGAKKVLSSVGN